MGRATVTAALGELCDFVAGKCRIRAATTRRRVTLQNRARWLRWHSRLEIRMANSS